MKYQFQIVGTQQYEYIMGEVEAEDPKTAVEAYYGLKKAFYVANGIPVSDFNHIYDTLRNEGELVGDPGVISQMSLAQKHSLNELKKSLKRDN